MSTSYLSAEREAEFPSLQRSDYQVTSSEDWVYNCIAHAAGKNDAWWWPTQEETQGVFWPKGVPREETLNAFVAAYMTEGYVSCDGSEPEPGFEKIAIYADAEGKPAHAARQLPSGFWTSKLGEWEDIEHRMLDSIHSPAYGKPVRYLKREIGKGPVRTTGQPSPSQHRGNSS